MTNEDTRLDQALDLTDNVIPPHTLLLNTYEVERFLKGGGMARTYLAHHKELNTRHVIKVIKLGLATALPGIDVFELFKREAHTLRSSTTMR